LVRWRRDIERANIPVSHGQTPLQIADSVACHSPHAGALARSFAQTLNNHYYGGLNSDNQQNSRQVLLRLKKLLVSQKKALRHSGAAS
ncbi:MAG: hypothetical protein R3276_12575, partial [Marinobacter sp.]|nr:hypothetical protein [Marinobacter sp.]